MTYTLTDANELRTVMEATADADTPVNLAQHSYFNLNGQARGTILDHILQINGCGAHQPAFQSHHLCCH